MTDPNRGRSITRRTFLRVSVVSAAALAASRPGWTQPRAERRPNILLILSDDHSHPHLGCYGNPDIKTPNLDRFAAQGMRFDRAYVTAPQCVPSRASIMTGRSPVRIQMTGFFNALPAEMVTYPELLRARGYFTGVAGRTHHLEGTSQVKDVLLSRKALRPFTDRLDYAKTTGKRSEIIAQFTEFLELAPKKNPFFLQLSFSDPRRPFDPDAFQPPHDPTRLKLPAHFPDTAALRADFARYYDHIARLDRDFGTVMATLDQRGVSDNTLVVFMGDNGASQLRGKGTLYEFGIHVPLLVRWPEVVASGRASPELISGEDLAPTFLATAGMAAPPDMTGRSFAGLLRGERHDGRRFVFSERGAHGAGLPQNTTAFDQSRCVVGKTHKLIYNAIWQIPYTPVDFDAEPFWRDLRRRSRWGMLPPQLSHIYFAPTRPMFELYDLTKDAREFDNLAGTPAAAAVEEELMSALREWMILERDFLPLPATPVKSKGSERAWMRGWWR